MWVFCRYEVNRISLRFKHMFLQKLMVLIRLVLQQFIIAMLLVLYVYSRDPAATISVTYLVYDANNGI